SPERIAQMRALYEKGDADAALALAVAMVLDDHGPPEPELLQDPYGGLIPVDDDASAQEEDHLSSVLIGGHRSSATQAPADVVIASESVPRVLIGPQQIAALPMDPRAAFILGHIDGVHSLEEILDVCAMPEQQALELIEKLCNLGVIAFDS